MTRQIKALKAQGKTYEEIAAEVGCSKSTVCYHLNPRTKQGVIDRQTQRRIVAKKRIVEHCGGKCVRCGYNKSIASLQFHHKDPSEKEFNIRDMFWDWEKTKAEAAKCELVCANCHGEIHEELDKQ